MEDLAGLDQRLHPRAAFTGALHGREEIHERLLIPRPGVFLQGLAQRLVLYTPAIEQFRRIGRKKCEWVLRIALVLRQVKANPAHPAPQRAAPVQPFRETALAVGDLAAGVFIQGRPQLLQCFSTQVFPAAHGRCGRGHLGQLRAWRWQRVLQILRRLGDVTQRGQIVLGQSPPVEEDRRQFRLVVEGGESHQTRGGGFCKRPEQRIRQRFRQGRRIGYIGRSQDQMAGWCQNKTVAGRLFSYAHSVTALKPVNCACFSFLCLRVGARGD